MAKIQMTMEIKKKIDSPKKDIKFFSKKSDDFFISGLSLNS